MSAPGVPSDTAGVTIVTQTRVRPEKSDDFGRLQREVAVAAAAFPGFLDQGVIPPSLPSQTDWVTMQWFADKADASTWLRSTARHALADRIAPLSASASSTYVVDDRAPSSTTSAATAVIATRVKAGRGEDYRAWQHQIAAAASAAPGYQGHRFEPPIEGVQDEWLTVLWFDRDDDLRAWLSSPERAATMRDVAPLIDTISARAVQTGFDQWFDTPPGESPPAAWKMSMLVLVVLYPTVFLIDTFLVPQLTERGVPFWLTLFGANTLTVAVLGLVVPLVSRPFAWWLSSESGSPRWRTWRGAAAVAVVYLVSLALTATYSLLT